MISLLVSSRLVSSLFRKEGRRSSLDFTTRKKEKENGGVEDRSSRSILSTRRGVIIGISSLGNGNGGRGEKRENRESVATNTPKHLRVYPGYLEARLSSFSTKLVGADRGVEKKLVAIKINYMHRNAR